MPKVVVVAFYHFVRFEDLSGFRESLLTEMLDRSVRGTVLVAHEGINGTIAGSRGSINAILSFLRSDDRLADLKHKESFTSNMPFKRTKVRLKKEIVSLGVEGIDPTVSVGQYLNPTEWNRVISDPDVTLVDTRNDYEFRVGTFEGAANPNTTSFRQFPEYVGTNLDPSVHKKVAMFCTGGIRCEKATSYMLSQGFESVYHLEGGILRYLEEVPESKSLWRGECFVFDDRVTVDHDLNPGHYTLCHACRMPLSADELTSPLYVEGTSCLYCHDSRSDYDRGRYAERERQMKLARQEGRTHLGVNPSSSD